MAIPLKKNAGKVDTDVGVVRESLPNELTVSGRGPCKECLNAANGQQRNGLKFYCQLRNEAFFKVTTKKRVLLILHILRKIFKQGVFS